MSQLMGMIHTITIAILSFVIHYIAVVLFNYIFLFLVTPIYVITFYDKIPSLDFCNDKLFAHDEMRLKGAEIEHSTFNILLSKYVVGIGGRWYKGKYRYRS